MAEYQSLRGVLDTNVMISGILWTGSSHKILKIAENRQIKIFASQEMIIEFLEVIKREKFSKRISELKTSVTEIVTGILRLVEIVKLEKYKLISHEIPVDKDDEMFLACALTAEASFIITGDPHLKVLKNIRGIRILSPHEFLTIVIK